MGETGVKALSIGARGWEHPEWWGSFYPEDMPPEWRLAYYAHEFRVVLVPDETWRKRPEEIPGWTADVPEDFEFYLEVPGFALEAAARASAELGARLGGWILRPGTGSSPADLADLLGPVSAPPRLAVDPGDAASDRPLGGGLVEAGVGPLWCGDASPTAAGIGLLRAGETPSDLRALRERIETFLNAARAPHAVLFLDGAPPDLDRLRDAQSIAALLGV